jgi:hypothetical protein
MEAVNLMLLRPLIDYGDYRRVQCLLFGKESGMKNEERREYSKLSTDDCAGLAPD